MQSHQTLQEIVQNFRSRGDSPALITVDGETMRAWDFVELVDTVERLTMGLVTHGLEPGEPVAIYAAGGPEWVIAFLAIVTAGGIAVPLDTALDGPALADPFRDSASRRVFVTSPHLARLIACGAADGAAFYLLDGGEDGGAPNGLFWRDLLADRIVGSPPVVTAVDIAALFYTSGTTGRPKGVPLSHGNLVANIDAILKERMTGAGDRILTPLPLHHVYPLIVGVLTPLAAGAAVVFPAGIGGPQIVEALRVSEANMLIGVPRLYAAMLDAIQARLRQRGRRVMFATTLLLAILGHLPSAARGVIGRVLFRGLRSALGPRLWLMACGGAHLDPHIWRTLEGFGWTVRTGYGLTETSPLLTFNPPGRPKVGSVGKPLSGVRVRIADPGADGVGEIQARGPNVFNGYRNRPRETAEAFTSDHWFRTGDLGRLDKEGYLHIAGRGKELIVLPNGENVFPEAVEAVYATSPLIREIGVFEHGGALVGLVAPDLDALRAHGAESAAQLIHDEIRDLSPSLPSFQRLSGYALTQTNLPRTTIGKLRRHLLPGLYERALAGMREPDAKPTAEDHAVLSGALARDVWSWLGERFPGAPLALDTSPQLDLGVDSLAWTGLSLEIEDRFGISLAEERIARIITLRDLLRELEDVAAEPAPARELLPERTRYLAPLNLVQRMLGAALYAMFFIAMRGLFRLRVVGIEQLPKSGPFVIVANHASWLDPIAVAASLPYAILRQARFAGWTGMMFNNAVTRTFSRIARVFPVDPDRGAASSLALGRAVLEQGEILIWFPEGRRSHTGDLLPFQPGIGAVLEDARAPVVPVFISGTFEAAPAGRLIPRLTGIEIRYGAPTTVETLGKSGRGETMAQRIANALRDAVSALRP